MDLSYRELLKTLVSEIRSNTPVIWFGAGVSFPSGLPTANQLVKKILKLTRLTVKEQIMIADLVPSKIPFERFMETLLLLMDETARKEILHLFTLGKPSVYHHFFARLIRKGYVKTLITTNFDTLLERALTENENLDPKSDFAVTFDPADFNNIDWTSDVSRIIKLHGSVEKPEALAISVSRVASPGAVQFVLKPVRHVFDHVSSGSLYVFGYSFSDRFDINPVIAELGQKGNSKQLYNFEYFPRGKGQIRVGGHSDFSNTVLAGFKSGLNIRGKSEVVILDLCKALGFNDIAMLTEREQWSSYLTRYISKLDEKHNGIVGDTLAGSFLSLVGAHRQSVKYYLKVVTSVRTRHDDRSILVSLQNLASAYLKCREPEKAREVLLKAKPIALRFEDGAFANHVLEQLSAMYHQTGDMCYQEGLALSNEAFEIAKRKKATDQMLPHLSGIAAGWMKLGDFDAAAKSFSAALSIAEQSGDMYRKAELYSNVASMYYTLRELDNAIEWYNKAIEIAVTSGDIENVGVFIMNRANIHVKRNNIEEALHDYENAGELLKKVLFPGHSTLELLKYHKKQALKKREQSEE